MEKQLVRDRKAIERTLGKDETRPNVGIYSQTPEGIGFITNGHILLWGKKIDQMYADTTPFLEGPPIKQLIDKDPKENVSKLSRIPHQTSNNVGYSEIVTACFNGNLTGLVFDQHRLGKCKGKKIIGFDARYVNLLTKLGITKLRWDTSEGPAVATNGDLKVVVMPRRT